MELQYFGANCLKIITKKATVVLDDNLAELGGKSVIKDGDIALFTNLPSQKVGAKPALIIDMPGEYEAQDVSIRGIAARAHTDTDEKKATIYRLESAGVRLAAVGHIYPDLDEHQLESLGVVDILVVPVGGHGFTLDPVGAQDVIKKIDPKIIIPVYYSSKKLNYQVPALSLDEALKGLNLEPKDTVDKIKIKDGDLIDERPQLIVLKENA